MNCTEIRPLLSVYYDGEATPEEHAQVEAHLAQCEECRRALAEYRAIGGELRALAVPAPPAGLRRDVYRAIEARQSGRRVSSAPVSRPQPRGTIVTLPDRQRAQKPTSIFTTIGRRTAALPAAVLLAGLLLVLAIVLIRNLDQTAVQAAQLQETNPLVDYGQPVHVLFSKSVVAADAERNTHVFDVSGSSPAAVATDNQYTASPTGGELSVKPYTTWKPGTKYQVLVDAPKIGRGINGNTLDPKPVELYFTTAQYTPTPSPTPTITPTPTNTPVRPSSTPHPSAVAQNSPVAPSTPPVLIGGPTIIVPGTPAAPKATATQQFQPGPSATPQPSNTPHVNPTDTSVPPQPSPTRTVEPTGTPVPPQPTHTPLPIPTDTATPRPTHTPVPVFSPTPEVTATPQHRATATATPGPRATSTPRPSSGTPTPTQPCAIMPVRGFGIVWQQNPDVRQRIGCPRAIESAIPQAAQQHFQGGFMFWRADTKTIYVFVGGPNDVYGTWSVFPDTWNDGDPMPSPTVTPPTGGLYAPVRGFGKLWYSNETIRQALGWATEPEIASTGAWQPFEHGNALWSSDKMIRIMYEDGMWQRFADTFTEP